MIIELLDKFIKEKGLAIRYIPEKIRSAYDVNDHTLKSIPNGEVQYLPEYKREMLVVYTVPKHAGELLVTQCKHTMKNVDFSQGMYFKDLGEMYKYYSVQIENEVK